MTLVTRTLSNTGEPLLAPNGSLLAGVAVSFTLVTASGRATDAWDATTHERVVGVVSTTTDTAGVFSVELWPNSRGNRPTQYLCHVDYDGVSDFRASVDAGVADLTWADFNAAGAALTASGLLLAAGEVSISAISGITATTVQAALAEMAARLNALEA